MKIPSRKKLIYRFEKFFAKGGISIFLSLVIAFLICFTTVVILRYILHFFMTEEIGFLSFANAMWATFLEMTDPGNMIFDTDSSRVMKISAILSGLLGVIIFSALIAFITTSLEKTLYAFRKGKGQVMETGHTLILGWNDRILDIIRELILANESEKKASIVILSDRDKEEMDDAIMKHIPVLKTTSIITRTGNPSSLYEINRVNTHKAKSVIMLSNCPDNALPEEKQESDIRSLKTIMAIIAVQNGDNKLPIIVEIFSEEQRSLIQYFNDPNIISINTWNLMGKLLLQTTLTSGLERVYEEMLSFAGNEIYFYKNDFGNKEFYELAFHFEDGVPMGIHKPDGTLILRPPEGTKLENDDEIVILATDDSTIHLQDKQLYTSKELPLPGNSLEKEVKKILILGWHEIGEVYIKQSEEYLKEGSSFDVMVPNSTEEIIPKLKSLQYDLDTVELNIFKGDPLSYNDLKNSLPFSYDNVIILSNDVQHSSADKIDSDTLLILLLLRKISQELHIIDTDTKIITQILNSENKDLLVQTVVDDFITTNKLITMVLAQLSEQPKIKKLYDDIFQQEGSEIYLKPAELYFETLPVTVTFADLMTLAVKREEICIGIRKGELNHDLNSNFGVKLNMAKDKQVIITKGDSLIVLAEDEL